MSTNSFVGTVDGSGRFWGRYVHWDGAPGTRLPILARLIARDGLETALDVLTKQHTGWSSLAPDATTLAPYYSEDRYVLVPGYGIAYAPDEQPDEWITGEIGHRFDTWGTRYGYVFDGDTLTVVEVVENEARPSYSVRSLIALADAKA